jgi:hypothetical protein
MIRFISIVVLTFALSLIGLGVITAWLEPGRRRLHGVALACVGLIVGIGYGFLGSRFSIALFGRLVVQVDLPALMLTAFTYTGGVVGGVALAFGLFLWATGRFRERTERTIVALVLLGVLVSIVATFLAIVLSAT